ncbi:MAG: class I SAM-dependent methyltransferase [Candidatus Bathyarchaeia archaeon]
MMVRLEDWYGEFGEYAIEEYIRERFLESKDEMERFYRVISLIPEDATSLLDVGCGTGIFLKLLHKYRGIEGVGIDISEVNVNFARAHGLLVEKGDVANLRFKDKSFDVVTALEVIEHLPYSTYKRALKEIARVSKRLIIISVPYNEKRRFITCPYCGTVFNPSYHIRSFKEKTLTSLFPGFKLQKIERVGVGYQPIFPEKLEKIIGILRRIPPTAKYMCPLCGFKRPPSKPRTMKDKRRSKIEGLLGFLLRRRQPRWIIAVYARNLLS